ncbi:DUF1080 domain-containing protein [Flavobacteriaceae bacterium]|nr:DUF1080 domain-containing protein [Flavobacteriaceae bacterium]
MKIIYYVITLMLLGSVATAQEQLLFNGKDLTGWDGKPGWWTVEDGALTSESTAEKVCHKANYLVWTGGEPADFELNLDFKLSPNANKSNSGVQIRSERRPDWDTFGYQADMTATGHLTGFVYHHSRGLIAARGEKVNITTAGKREVQKLGDSEQLNAAFQPGEWNHYRILCAGPKITLYINDVLVCEFTDNDPQQARAKGIIALQMHPGPPMKVQFKNIVLKTLETAAEDAAEREAALIAVLKSDTDVIAKTVACRELALVGTSAAVPALSALLTDEQLTHMARYGLQPIPGDATDAALRSVLQSLSGQALAGVIHTIGQRRDSAAVNALLALLGSADATVAQASAAALGEIGTKQAAQGLQAALPEAEGLTQLTICEGLFECAEALESMGNKAAASALYDALRALPHAPKAVQSAALRAAIIVRGKDGLSLLAKSLRSDDALVAQSGMRTALELNGGEIAELVAGEIKNVSADRQVLLAGLLGELGQAQTLPVLLGLAKAGDTDVRLASINAVSQIGGSSAITPLMEWMKDPDSGISKAAATGLTGLRGAGVDDAVVNRLMQNDSQLQPKLAEIAAQRRIEQALPVLSGLMADPRAPVRLAAIKSYGELANVDQLPVLLSVIKTSTQKGDITALGKAIALVCIKADAPKVCVAQLVATLEVAVPEATPMLQKVLKRMGGAEVLKTPPPVVSDGSLSGAAWIWSENNPGHAAPGTCYFKKMVTLPKGSQIKSAQIIMTADDALTLWVNGEEVADGTFWQDLVVEDLRAFFKEGDNLIEVEARNEGQTPTPAGLICKLEIHSVSGAPIIVLSDNTWSVSKTRNVTGQPAIKVANYGDAPWGKLPK